jgi:hypothetical protein
MRSKEQQLAAVAVVLPLEQLQQWQCLAAAAATKLYRQLTELMQMLTAKLSLFDAARSV